MGPELLPAESLLGLYRARLSWPGVLITWMGVLVALSVLGAILYIGLLWADREAARCTSPRRGWIDAEWSRSEKKKRSKSDKLTRKGSGWSPASTVSE